MVTTNMRPACEPMSAMAGVTNPKIISGMMNPKNSLKIPLKVTKIRTIASGRKLPKRMPRAMAIIIRPNRLYSVIPVLLPADEQADRFGKDIDPGTSEAYVEEEIVCSVSQSVRCRIRNINRS